MSKYRRSKIAFVIQIEVIKSETRLRTSKQWDDGNNSNFDGWSKDCKVEFNYVCNPSPGQGDICTTIYDKPKILSASFDVNKLQISVFFDQTMLSQNITSNDISCWCFRTKRTLHNIVGLHHFRTQHLLWVFRRFLSIMGGYNEAIDLQLLNVYMHSKVLMRLRWCLQLDTCLDIRLQTRTSRTKAQVRVLRTHLYFRFWYQSEWVF